jgi:putative flippase GtrA
MSTHRIALLVRWLVFNGVGVIGAVVQLATIAVLVNGAGLHYAPATIIAVEAAVLHNFAWHRRWTWRDRPGAGAGPSARRALVRFHVSNGLVSIVGNLLVMAVLAGALGMAPVAANAVAILACSLLNFALGDRWVFPEAQVL